MTATQSYRNSYVRAFTPRECDVANPSNSDGLVHKITLWQMARVYASSSAHA